MLFKHRLRVYYDATDAGGVVYHSHYLNYIEHTRMEYFLHHGYDAARLQYDENLTFVAVESNMKWIKPARVGDELEITMQAVDSTRVSVTFEHGIYRIEPNGERTLLNSAEIKMVCVSVEPMKARSIPAEMKQCFFGSEDLSAAA